MNTAKINRIMKKIKRIEKKRRKAQTHRPKTELGKKRKIAYGLEKSKPDKNKDMYLERRSSYNPDIKSKDY